MRAEGWYDSSDEYHEGFEWDERMNYPGLDRIVLAINEEEREGLDLGRAPSADGYVYTTFFPVEWPEWDADDQQEFWDTVQHWLDSEYGEAH